MKFWSLSLFCYIGLTFIFVGHAAQAQRIIQVPGNAPTVQAGINMANAGDTVSIAPGTYIGPINFNGKAITVSGSGPGVILDGGSADGPVVTFNSGETRSSILQNVTVQNGSSAPLPTAGGIYISQASPTILNSVIQNNQGCGIGVISGAPLIQGNKIVNNRFEVNSTSPGCLPVASSFFGGGGIVLYGASAGSLFAQILANTVEANTVIQGAAGIYAIDAGRPFIESNTISNNLSGTLGSGIGIEGNTSPIVIQNLVYGNTIDTTNVENPTRADAGAGLNLDFASGSLPGFPTYVINNTFADNILVGPGPKYGTQILLVGAYNNVSFYNNLIVGADALSPVFCIADNPVGSPPVGLPSFYNNDVSNTGSESVLYGGSCTNQTGQNGNISVDPNFVTSASSPNPYQLGLPSQAIDSGDNNAPMLPQLDFLGQPRIQNAKGLSSGIVDMGVYEYPGVPATVPPPADFTLTVNPSSITARQGQNVTFSVTVTPTAANMGTILLTCSGLPTTMSCMFSSPTMSFTNIAPQSSTLTISIGTTQAISLRYASSGGDFPMFAGLVLIPILLVGRRGIARKGAPWILRLGVIGTLFACVGLSGCGPDRYIVIGAPQTYQVGVQAIAVKSGLSRQTIATLVITQ
jgi:parallel beta-helix repeat protein